MTRIIAPCPFCGAMPEVDDEGRYYGLYYVRCLNCDARGPLGDDADEAIRLWNKRANTITEGGTIHPGNQQGGRNG